MSLEEALAANTAAIKEQTAFLKTLQTGGGKAPAETAATTTKPAGTKPKKLSLDALKEKAGSYLGIEDKKERKARAEKVTKLIEHFNVEKVSDIGEENWAEAMAAFEAFEKGEMPDFLEEDAGAGDGDSLV